jgi:hypothetical protein
MTVIEAHAKAEFVFANGNLKRLVDLIMAVGPDLDIRRSLKTVEVWT